MHLYSSRGVGVYGTGLSFLLRHVELTVLAYGYFVSFISDSDGLCTREPMLQQLVLSFRWAMVGQARFTAFALTYTRAMRSVVYFPHLPHRFTLIQRLSSTSQTWTQTFCSTLIAQTGHWSRAAGCLRVAHYGQGQGAH